MESVSSRENGAAGLLAFLSRAEKSGPASCVLFLPATRGAWLPRVLAVLRTRQPMRVLIGVDAVRETAVPSRWWKILFRRSEQAFVGRSELSELVKALRSVRADVMVLNRETGRVWTETTKRAPGNQPRTQREAA